MIAVLEHLDSAQPKQPRWKKYRSSVIIGILAGLLTRAILGAWFTPTEVGVLVVLTLIGYFVWLCSRHE
jgi:hypothetical protein